jgi:hypothetical protein
VDDSNGDTLISDKSDLKAQTTKLGTIYYRDINLFFLRNPDNLKRDILIIKINF